MSIDDQPLDDSSIEDPWERAGRLGGALEIVADRQDLSKLRRARMLLQSLEQQIEEED